MGGGGAIRRTVFPCHFNLLKTGHLWPFFTLSQVNAGQEDEPIDRTMNTIHLNSVSLKNSPCVMQMIRMHVVEIKQLLLFTALKRSSRHIKVKDIKSVPSTETLDESYAIADHLIT